MRVYIRWNKESVHGKNKPWRVMFDDSEIFCDNVELVTPVKTETMEYKDSGFRGFVYVEVSKVIYENGNVSFEV
jgi:hypothetical protein